MSGVIFSNDVGYCKCDKYCSYYEYKMTNIFQCTGCLNIISVPEFLKGEKNGFINKCSTQPEMRMRTEN